MANLGESAKKIASGKFIRLKDGPAIYSMGETCFQKLARESGACYRINQKLTLVNVEEFEKFLESFRVVDNK